MLIFLIVINYRKMTAIEQNRKIKAYISQVKLGASNRLPYETQFI
jgi:hypothetical protein